MLGELLPCVGGSLETRSHLTEVRLSDREFYKFALRVDNGNVGITGACEGVARFQFLDGTLPGATLQILDGTRVIYLRAGPDQLLDMNDFLDGVERIYEPRRVRLTTIDGRRIDLTLTSGIERIEDNNGNALSITDAGIVHSSGRSVAFTRDARGRLSRITDPLGHTVEYTYTADDLTAVTDQTGAVTTFAYDSLHNLVEMHDPLGNRAVLAEYRCRRPAGCHHRCAGRAHRVQLMTSPAGRRSSPTGSAEPPAWCTTTRATSRRRRRP